MTRNPKKRRYRDMMLRAGYGRAASAEQAHHCAAAPVVFLNSDGKAKDTDPGGRASSPAADTRLSGNLDEQRHRGELHNNGTRNQEALSSSFPRTSLSNK
jgi:hypothetical protein